MYQRRARAAPRQALRISRGICGVLLDRSVHSVICGTGNAAEGRELGASMIMLDLRRNEVRLDLIARVAVHRCQKRFNQHQGNERQRC